MSYLLDTSVAIALRDADPKHRPGIEALGPDLAISIITRIELEGGVRREPGLAAARLARLDVLLGGLEVVAFNEEAADAYRIILETTGFSRRKTLDRMIAAQAIIKGATLVTLNGADFSDIPELKLLAW